MPIYEYRCSACSHQLDTMQKISETPLTICPECHQATLQKLVSVAGFQLKGSGWYATDYKNKTEKTAEKPAEKSSTTDSSSTTTTTNTTTTSTTATS